LSTLTVTALAEKTGFTTRTAREVVVCGGERPSAAHNRRGADDPRLPPLEPGLGVSRGERHLHASLGAPAAESRPARYLRHLSRQLERIPAAATAPARRALASGA